MVVNYYVVKHWAFAAFAPHFYAVVFDGIAENALGYRHFGFLLLNVVEQRGHFQVGVRHYVVREQKRAKADAYHKHN